MKFASAFVDAVVISVLTGLALSCVVGCAGVRMDSVERSLELAAEQRAADLMAE